jgi:hypothetical protein
MTEFSSRIKLAYSKAFTPSGASCKYTGLGRKADGSVDADSEYWKPYVEVHFSHTYLMFASTIHPK